MGYDVHITREAEFWEGGGITLQEWEECVATDDSMRLDGYAETETPGGTLRYENEGLTVWLGDGGQEEDGHVTWFDFRNEYISVKNPDQKTLNKMIELAQLLAAQVVGDEGETYDADQTKECSSQSKVIDHKPWWKFWKTRVE